MGVNGALQHGGAIETIKIVQVQDPKMLRLVWPYVLRGIRHIKKRDPDCGNWNEHHVHNAIIQGFAAMRQGAQGGRLIVVLTDAGALQGFIVTLPKPDPWSGGIIAGIYVWLAYSHKRGFDLIEQFLPWFEDDARLHGYETIEFETCRVGWLRKQALMKRIGFECYQYRWRKKIAYD